MIGSGAFHREASGPDIESGLQPMKLRIPPRLHGPLAALGFLLLMILVGILESIGGAQ